jgi:hypothetical protein
MRPFALLIPLGLAACVEAESPPYPGDMPPPLPPEDSCGAPDLQFLRGQPETVLQTMKFGVPVRIIRPGMKPARSSVSAVAEFRGTWPIWSNKRPPGHKVRGAPYQRTVYF